MVDVILCLVSVFFMIWVIHLKLEIETLKGISHKPGKRPPSASGQSGAVKGNRNFNIE